MRNYKSLIAAAAVMAFVGSPVLAATTAGVSSGSATSAIGGVSAAAGGNNAVVSADTSTSATGAVNAAAAGSNGTDTNTAATASGSVTANGTAAADFSQIMTSVQGAQAGTTQIQALKSVKSVNVIKITDIATGDTQAALDKAMTSQKQGMASLRSAVCSNTAIHDALSKKSVNCKNVVSANVSADGALTVYVD